VKRRTPLKRTKFVSKIRARINPISKTRRARSGVAGKLGIIRLDAAGMRDLRAFVYDRADGYCEMVRDGSRCMTKADWWHGELAHIKSRGAGGSDTARNTRWACKACHHKQHNPKACPKKPSPAETKPPPTAGEKGE